MRPAFSDAGRPVFTGATSGDPRRSCVPSGSRRCRERARPSPRRRRACRWRGRWVVRML